jgi:hypothetical protein
MLRTPPWLGPWGVQAPRTPTLNVVVGPPPRSTRPLRRRTGWYSQARAPSTTPSARAELNSLSVKETFDAAPPARAAELASRTAVPT